MSAKEQKGSIDVIIDFCHAYISLDNSKPSVLGMNARKNENGARSCDYHYKSKVRVKGEIILCTLTLFDSSHMLKYRVSVGAENRTTTRTEALRLDPFLLLCLPDNIQKTYRLTWRMWRRGQSLRQARRQNIPKRLPRLRRGSVR